MSEYICELEDARYEMEWAPKEEVVRCEDCEEFKPYHTYAGDVLDCGMCLKHDCETWKNRFCYWAIRKERIEQ